MRKSAWVRLMDALLLGEDINGNDREMVAALQVLASRMLTVKVL